MKNNKDSQFNAQGEVNLKMFFLKLLRYKWFFIFSIILCSALAMVYLKLATPQYEASTSILIDASGNTRSLGENKYVQGGVSLIEIEKNLYNEIGIIKSFTLIRKTVEDLGFDISYYSKNLLKNKEAYKYFPFEVTLSKDKSQIHGLPFKVELLSKDKYKLTIEGDEFTVFNGGLGSGRKITRSFTFSKEFAFGEEVNHNYFSFRLDRPQHLVDDKDFEGEELSFVVKNLDAVTAGYVSEIQVGNIDLQASIFNISSVGSVVEKEIDFLNKLTDNYIKGNLNSRNEIASTKKSFISDQLTAVADSLNQIEFQLEEFKREKKAINLVATGDDAIGQSSALEMDRAKIIMNRKYYRSLIENVRRNRNSEEFKLPTAIGIDDPLITENISEIKNLYNERTKKKFFVTNDNQEIQILNNQISQSIDLLLNNLRNATKSADLSLQKIDSQLKDYNGVMSSLPAQQKELLSIQRKNTLYGNLYDYLSQELAKNDIAGAESTSDTKILDSARMLGSEPIAPQKKLVLLLGMIIGVIIPMIWIVIFSSKGVIENVDQIMANSDIPVIASIVHHDPKASKSKSELSKWKLKESFRDLCTNLSLVSTKENGVIGMSSVMPEEGKTYNTINLGITLAESGKKTLIIDTDLRNPSILGRMKSFEGKGLSNYLSNEISDVNDIIYPHETLDHLKFIPTLPVEGNVHELLTGPKMKELVDALKSNYDYIILDTPAVGLVSDFLMLSELIDINLFVVRKGLAKLSFLEDIEDISSKGKKKSFIIFNGVPVKDHKYGYEQKYGRNKETQLVNKSLSV